MSRIQAIILYIFLLLLFSATSVPAFNFSSSHTKIKNPPPIHLSHQAFDIIDIARLELPKDANQIATINELTRRLGDYLAGQGLEVLGTNGIPAKPLAKDGSIKYAYGNWLVKTAESTGIRLLEVRINDLEQQIVADAPQAAAALPFRFILMADFFYGKTFIHFLAIDPLLFTSRFIDINESRHYALIEARKRLCHYIAAAFPEAYYDPQLPLKNPKPVAAPTLELAAQVNFDTETGYNTIEDVVAAVQNGSVKIFSGTVDEHKYTINGEFPDYNYLNDETTVHNGTLPFPLFSMIKDGWKKIDGKKTFFPDWKLKNHSQEIEALIQNSFLHVYGMNASSPEQRLKFTSNTGAVYTLQVFDAYTDPLLLHSGVWHYQTVPTSILFYEATPGTVDILIQNPVATTARYYSDVSDKLLASFKPGWDTNPANRTDWPESGKMKMAERSRETLIKVINNAITPAPGQKLLVSPETLALTSKNPNLKIIDARAVGYDEAHIPGSVSLPWTEISTASGKLKPIAELEALLTSKGIQQSQILVIYDNGDNYQSAAARLFWMFEYLGCTDVNLLDGGLSGWRESGLETETGASIQSPDSKSFIATLRPEVAITTAALSSKLEDGNITVIDSRSDAQYNGWIREDELVGGHIAGAQQIPCKWLFRDKHRLRDYVTLKDIFIKKGLQVDDNIAVYSTKGVKSSMTYFALRLLGYKNIANYDGSYLEWSDNSYNDPANFPIEKLKYHERLVDAQWVKQKLLANNNSGKPFVIIDTGWGPASEAYLEAHIPGTIYVNTDEIEYDDFYARNNPPADIWFGRSTTEEEDLAKGLTGDDTLPKNYWNIYPDQYLLPALAYMGITTDTTVVVYGADVTAAARVIYAMMYAGVKDVRLLNGGINAWLTAGYATESGLTKRTPAAWFGTDEPLHPEYLVDTDYIREVVNGIHPDAVIADIRTWDEYIGKTAPYSYIPTDGRIAGAVWGHAGDGPWTMEDFVDCDGTLRSYTEVEKMWAKEGITADKNISYYCGTGWRAALTFFYGYMMGWERVNLYDGGWYEWSLGDQAADNPIIDDTPDLPIY